MNKPNILWICTDQQRFDTIQALGTTDIRTPNLNKLVEQGVSFTRAYSQSPICTPSRASFLSGLYPSSIHVTRNGNEFFPENVTLITKKIADQGYKCGLVGKLHLAAAFTGREKRVDDGYEVVHYCHGPIRGTPNENDYQKWLVENGVDLDDVFNKNKKGEYYGYKPTVNPEHHQTTWCVNKAIEFIQDASASQPWLLSINIFDPHTPNDAPQSYKERCLNRGINPPLFEEGDLETQEKLRRAFRMGPEPKKPDEKVLEEKASYYGMIELIDEQLGRLFDELEKSGQKENTLIIFMSDHGEMMGDHGIINKGCRFYEGAVHVPLIISWPGNFEEGKICEGLVELTDIVPTIADLLGISLERTHGYSLLPVLKGEQNTTERTYVRSEYYEAVTETTEFYDAVIVEGNKPSYATMYYDGRYKLIRYHHFDYGELYDHTSDPNEHHNLWEEEDYQSVKLRLLLESFDASTIIADPGPPKKYPF